MPVVVQTSKVPVRSVRPSMVQRAATAMLTAVGRGDAELSVLLCGDEVIHALNRDFRNKDKPTDVLAFAMNEGEGGHLHPFLLGDVVISVETATRQAKEHDVSIAREVRTLLAHGILHLLGYDHQNPTDYRRMMARQEFLVRVSLGKNNEGGS